MARTRTRSAAVHYEESSDESGSSGSEAEQQVYSPAPGSRSKTRGALAPSARRPAARAAARQTAAKATVAPAAGSLLEAVRQPSAAADAARDWTTRYTADRRTATAELLNFLLQACGVFGVNLTVQDVEQGSADDTRKRADDTAMQLGLSPQFQAKGQRAFRAAYLEFWSALVRESGAKAQLFDQYLMDHLTALVISLNTSAVREFRQVATLTAVQLVSSCLQVNAVLAGERDTAQGQADAEARRRGPAAAGAAQRAAAFRRAAGAAHSRVGELAAYCDALFQGVFAHRFRDVCPAVRSTTVAGVGAWALLAPATYMTDTYLKYVAWALSDRDAAVRATALDALLALYAAPENVGPLHAFAARFKPRFRELVDDVDDEVAARGIRLLTRLAVLGVVPTADLQGLHRLLGDASPGIRHAAAALVASGLESAAAAGAAGGAHDARAALLRGLLAVCVDLWRGAPRGARATLVAHVVDALAGRLPLLADWPALVAGLEAAAGGDDGGGGEGETALALAMLVRESLRRARAAAGAEARGRAAREAATAAAAARQEATVLLAGRLPGLLRRHARDGALTAELVALVPEMRLEVYVLLRKEKEAADLLGIVQGLITQHASVEAVEACAAALAHAARDGPGALRDGARALLDRSMDAALCALRAALDALDEAGEEGVDRTPGDRGDDGEAAEHALAFDVRVAAEQLAALAAVHARCEGAGAPALRLLARRPALGPAARRAGVRAAGAALMWRLQALQEAGAAAATEELEDLARERDALVAALELRLQDRGVAGDEVLATCETLADTYLLFGRSLHNSPLAALAYEPSAAAVARFWRGCEDLIRCLEATGPEPTGDALPAPDGTVSPGRVRRLLLRASQLVVFGSVAAAPLLAAGVLSHWGCAPPGLGLDDLARELTRLLRAGDSGALPAAFLAAMQAAWERAGEAEPPAPGDLEEGEEPRDACLRDFNALAHRFAQKYSGFSASAAATAHVVRGGATWALQGAPHRIDFLMGVAHFVTKLPPDTASQVLAFVQATAEREWPHPQTGSPEAELYLDFLQLLEERAHKGGIKPALKKGKEALQAGTSAKGVRSERRITFGKGADEDDGDLIPSGTMRQLTLDSQGGSEEPRLEASSDEDMLGASAIDEEAEEDAAGVEQEEEEEEEPPRARRTRQYR
ncbi:SCC3 [Auxenochlorella protothecoides x Auxenochlorella symbiontica]